MLKKLKHGFTLVELVIVIAVIAVLAAVLIPTFITVIDNANNSADVQLVANMNTVLVTDIHSNETATGTNLRKLLKDNGITNITTKKKDNIICYNQNTNRFELINLSKTDINPELSSGTAATADVSTDGALIVDPNPFSFDEIFKGYTIVSTSGNDLSEAIYKSHILSNSANLAATDPRLALAQALSNNVVNPIVKGNMSSKEAFLEAFKTMLGAYRSPSSGSGTVTRGTTGFIVKLNNGELIPFKASIKLNANNSDAYDTCSYEDFTSIDKLLINEDITELDLRAFENLGAVVILPNTVEKVTVSEGDDFDLSKIYFVGNTDVLIDYAKSQIDTGEFTQEREEEILHNAQIGSSSIWDIKDEVTEFGSLISETEYYVVSAESTHKDDEHYYTDLQTALNAAANSARYSGHKRDVIIAENLTISSDITVPAGVTLQIPYETTVENGKTTYSTGFCEARTAGQGVDPGIRKAEAGIVDDAIHDTHFNQFDVTLAKGKTITIEKDGAVQIGGVIAVEIFNAKLETNLGYSGQTAGNYGQITNNGTIKVQSGGELDVWGYIKGDGSVIAEDGSSVYEPLIITDTVPLLTYLSIFVTGASPFDRYAVLNIQNKFTVNYGATVYIRIGMNNLLIPYIDAKLVGNTGENELISMQETDGSNNNVVFEYKYDSKQVITDNNANSNLKGDIGKTTVTINGSITTGGVLILGLDGIKIDGHDSITTSDALFPIPYNFEYIINGTFNVKNKFVVLPGATVQVNEGGTLNVTENSEFYVADFVYQESGIDNKKYPTAEQLTTAGYSASGMLIVNGTMNVAANAQVGGIVRSTEGKGTLTIDSNANVAGVFTVGGSFITSSTYDNTCYCTCPLRIAIGGQLTNAVAGKTYTASGAAQDITGVKFTVKCGGGETKTDHTSAEMAVNSCNWTASA